MEHYFGTDGVRGHAEDYITNKLAYRIGRFIGHSKINDKTNKILIGRDTRISGKRITDAIVKGLLASGAIAYDLGVTTTPSVSYLVETNDFDYGIMISASHNPYTDNGIKIFAPSGEKLNNEIELLIEDYIDAEQDYLPFVNASILTNYIDSSNLLDNYLNYVAGKALLNNKKYKILLDCAHGSACVAAKKLFKDLLHQDVTLINDTYNGKDINLDCGSTHLEEICRVIKKGHYDVGFAFDGDADRLMSITPNGEVLDGDGLMVAAAFNLKAHNKLNKDKIVITTMSNLGVKKALKKFNLGYEEVDVGDKYVQACLKQKNMSLGGEQSGHVIFYEDLNTGCGLLSAVHVLNILSDENTDMDTLLHKMKKYPQLLINVPVKDKEYIMNNKALTDLILEITNELGEEGRVLIRPSGTEQLIRVMVEASDSETCQKYVQKAVNLIETLN